MARLLITSSNHSLLVTDPRTIRLILLQEDDDKSGVDDTKQVADCNNAVLQAPIHCLPPFFSPSAVIGGGLIGRGAGQAGEATSKGPAAARARHKMKRHSTRLSPSCRVDSRAGVSLHKLSSQLDL